MVAIHRLNKVRWNLQKLRTRRLTGKILKHLATNLQIATAVIEFDLILSVSLALAEGFTGDTLY